MIYIYIYIYMYIYICMYIYIYICIHKQERIDAEMLRNGQGTTGWMKTPNKHIELRLTIWVYVLC